MGALVRVVKKPEEEPEGEIVTPDSIVTSNVRSVNPEPYKLSNIGEPVTEADVLFWKGRMARVPLYEELTLRLLMEIRDGLKKK